MSDNYSLYFSGRNDCSATKEIMNRFQSLGVMCCTSFQLSTAVAVVLLCLVTSSQTLAASLNASSDVWIRSISPTTTFEDDALSVRDEAITGDARYSIIEFDLSSVTPDTLVSASLDLTVRSADNVQQDSFLIDTSSGTSAGAMTWDAYQAEQEGSESYTFESIGVEPVSEDPADGTLRSTFASANDLAQIQSILNGGGLLTIALKPGDATSNVDWTDTGLDGVPPVLNLNFVPEPSSFVLMGLGTLLVFRRRWS